MRRRLATLFAVALTVVGLDQLTKALALTFLAERGVRLIPGFADLVLAFNKGAAFSSFAGLAGGRWMLVGLTTLAVLLIIYVAMRGNLARTRLGLTCLSLVMGGALGNLIDRVRTGLVVDFVFLHVGNYGWPVFNLADSAITIGGAVLAVQLLRGKA